MVLRGRSRTHLMRSVVVPYRPYQRALRVLLVLLWLASLGGAYWWGSRGSVSADARVQRDLLLAEQSALADARQQISNLSTGAALDRQAVEEVRAVIREQKTQIANLREELALYRDTMDPSDREKGISVRSWTVQATAEPSRFLYRAVVQQLASKHQNLKGQLQVKLSGRDTEGERSYPLEDLSEQFKAEQGKLQFKYFQIVVGELVLPEGFEPQSVDLSASTRSPIKLEAAKQFNWQVEED